jgi:tetratricopeptide (TPR) repeat protein
LPDLYDEGKKVPSKRRIPIPKDVAARTLFESDRTCCVCRSKKPVQIHHIDDDPSNNDPGNLAVLCFDCHLDTQVQGGFDRKLDAEQVRLYKRDWLEVVRRYRADQPTKEGKPADHSIELRTTVARLQTAMKDEDWFDVARVYDGIGDIKHRDEYIEKALSENPSPYYEVLLRRMQGRAADLPEDLKSAAAEEVEDDWTALGGILLDVGRVEEAVRTWLEGVQRAIDTKNWFTAAFYIRHTLDAEAVEPLLTMALKQAVEEDDLWWQMRCYEELGWDDAVRELLLGNETRIEESGPLILKRKLAMAKGDHEDYIKLTEELAELGPAAYYLVSEEVENSSDEEHESEN